MRWTCIAVLQLVQQRLELHRKPYWYVWVTENVSVIHTIAVLLAFFLIGYHKIPRHTHVCNASLEA